MTGTSIKFTASKLEDPRSNEECSIANLQSSVKFIFRGLRTPVDDEAFKKYLGRYGDVKEIRSSKSFQKIAEFYDRRAAIKAFKEMDDSKFKEGEVKCRWVWDLSPTTRTKLIEGEEEENSERKRARRNPTNVFEECFNSFILKNLEEIEAKIIKRRM